MCSWDLAQAQPGLDLPYVVKFGQFSSFARLHIIRIPEKAARPRWDEPPLVSRPSLSELPNKRGVDQTLTRAESISIAMSTTVPISATT